MLGRHIGRFERRGDQPVRRGNIDDPPPFAFFHAGYHRFGGIKGRRQVQRQNRLPFLVWEILNGRDKLNSCVVDQHINLSKRGLGGGNQAAYVVGFHHVSGRVDRFDAMRIFQRPARGFDLFGRLDTVQHDVVASGGKPFGDAVADAAGRSGDDGGSCSSFRSSHSKSFDEIR